MNSTHQAGGGGIPASAGGGALAAIVVLYQPTKAHRANLLHLHSAGLPMVAVDNSPGSSIELSHELNASGIDCIVNGNVGGIGAAFNRGVAHLAARGFEAFLLLDQDSVLWPRFVEAMERAVALRLAAGESAFLIGPRVYDVRGRRYVPIFRAHGRLMRSVRPPADAATSDVLLPCNFLISSGCVVSLAAHRLIGAWREDFVVDHVDTDYAMRAARSGVPLYVLPSLTLQHTIGRQRSRRFMGLTLLTFDHQPQRRYYLARNAVALARGEQVHVLAVAMVNLLTLMQLCAIWLMEQDKGIKTRALLTGLVDGLMRRSGPIEAARPALARQCSAATQAPAGITR